MTLISRRIASELATKKQRRLRRESCLHCPSTRHHYNVNCDPVLIILQALVFNFNQSRWGLMYSFPYNYGPFWKGALGYYLERQELLKRIPHWELSRQSGTLSDMEVHSIHSKRKGAGLWLYLWGRCFQESVFCLNIVQSVLIAWFGKVLNLNIQVLGSQLILRMTLISIRSDS